MDFDHRYTFDFGGGREFILKCVGEGMCGNWFEVWCVLATGGRRVTTLTHTRVITQPSFIQVWVSKGIGGCDTFSLETKSVNINDKLLGGKTVSKFRTLSLSIHKDFR